MKEFIIPKDITTIGKVVNTFPLGIDDAFQSLVKIIPGGFNRPYYGIAEGFDGKMRYIAAAMEREEGEGKRLGLQTFKIEKGIYLAEDVSDWRSKTSCIKDVFEQIFRDERVDRTKPCIEIYENDSVMHCLVRVKEASVVEKLKS